jgi:adenylate kinase
MAKEGEVLIVDTHMIVRTEEGYWAGLPSAVLAELRPNLFILIEAEPNEILERRFLDKSRRRDEELTAEIKEEMVLARMFASSCGVITCAPVKIIRNPTGKQMEAAKEILKLCKP